MWLFVLWMVGALAAPELIPLEAFELPPAPAASLQLPLRDGGTFDLADYRGKVVVLSFWASWCGPCRHELPALSELAASRPDVVFLAVNVDRQKAPAEHFLKSVRVDVPIAFDTAGAALGDFGVVSMPTMFVIDKTGAVRHQKVGYSQERGLTEISDYIDEVSR